MSSPRPSSSRRTRAPVPMTVALLVGFVPLGLLTVGLPYTWNDQGAGSYRVAAVALALYLVLAGMLIVGTPATAGQRPYGIFMFVAMVGFGATAVATALDDGSGRALLMVGYATLAVNSALVGYAIGRRDH